MPNWCSCRLKVDATSAEDLKPFYEKIEAAGEFSFELYHPTPEELKNIEEGFRKFGDEVARRWRPMPVPHSNFPQDVPLSEGDENALIAKYGACSPMDWAIRHWGTKWDADEPLVDIRSLVCDINFSTAWSPPVHFVEAVSRQFPKLVFTLYFSEMGAGYWGYETYSDGVKVTESVGGEMFADRPDNISEEEWDSMDTEDKLTEEYSEFIRVNGLSYGG